MSLIGATVTEIREMKAEEIAAEGWQDERFDGSAAIVFDTGHVIYASQDYEGNGSGAIFGVTPDGQTVTYTPPSANNDDAEGN